jgi:predicted DNA-binding transcriptional regulator AlpA
MMTNDPLLTSDEAAEFLGVSRRTLEGWRLLGLPPVFVRYSSRSVRYRKSDLVAFIEHATVEPRAE